MYKLMTVQVREERLETFKKLAHKHETTLSELVRDLLEKEVERVLGGKGVNNP